MASSPEYHRNYMRERYRNDPEYRERHKARVKQNKHDRRERMKQFIQDSKSACVKCGEQRKPLLQFHHRDGETKEFCVANAPRTLPSQERLEAEIAKCDVLCAHCHILLHADG